MSGAPPPTSKDTERRKDEKKKTSKRLKSSSSGHLSSVEKKHGKTLSNIATGTSALLRQSVADLSALKSDLFSKLREDPLTDEQRKKMQQYTDLPQTPIKLPWTAYDDTTVDLLDTCEPEDILTTASPMSSSTACAANERSGVYAPSYKALEESLQETEDGIKILAALRKHGYVDNGQPISIPIDVFVGAIREASILPAMNEAFGMFEKSASVVNSAASSLAQSAATQMEVTDLIKAVANFALTEEQAWARQRLVVDFIAPILLAEKKVGVSLATICALKMIDVMKLGGMLDGMSDKAKLRAVLMKIAPIVEELKRKYPGIAERVPADIQYVPH